MALSKACKDDESNFKEKINKLDYVSNIDRHIHDEEIDIFCVCSSPEPISIKNIQELVFGSNAKYSVMEVADSFECYQVLRQKLVKNLHDSKEELLFFEDRSTANSNIIVCVVEKINKSKKCPQFKALVRMTIMSEPKVAYCRFFDYTGMSCFMFFLACGRNIKKIFYL